MAEQNDILQIQYNFTHETFIGQIQFQFCRFILDSSYRLFSKELLRAVILYFLYTIKISAAQNFTPDIVSILHSLITKALVKYKIGLYMEDYIEN